MTNPSARDVLQNLTRTIPDFPEPGVQFKDLTPVLADAAAFGVLADALATVAGVDYDIVAGIEARGFALAAAVAARHGSGLLLVRKAGKLPGPRIAESYALEYGEATLEVHTDQVPAGSRILVVDDVLATGGTLAASHRLIERAGWQVAATAVALEIPALGGRAKLAGRAVHALLEV